jgi:hypothetical protein
MYLPILRRWLVADDGGHVQPSMARNPQISEIVVDRLGTVAGMDDRLIMSTSVI